MIETAVKKATYDSGLCERERLLDHTFYNRAPFQCLPLETCTWHPPRHALYCSDIASGPYTVHIAHSARTYWYQIEYPAAELSSDRDGMNRLLRKRDERVVLREGFYTIRNAENYLSCRAAEHISAWFSPSNVRRRGDVLSGVLQEVHR
jgi:hypothetical protein